MQEFQAGIYLDLGTYKSLVPCIIYREREMNDMHVLSLLTKADYMLERLDMFSEHIPNIDLFISMHIVKEAMQSEQDGVSTFNDIQKLEKENEAIMGAGRRMQ